MTRRMSAEEFKTLPREPSESQKIALELVKAFRDRCLSFDDEADEEEVCEHFRVNTARLAAEIEEKLIEAKSETRYLRGLLRGIVYASKEEAPKALRHGLLFFEPEWATREEKSIIRFNRRLAQVMESYGEPIMTPEQEARFMADCEEAGAGTEEGLVA